MAQRFRTLVALAEVPGSIPKKKPSETWPWGTRGTRLLALHLIAGGKIGGKRSLLSVGDKNDLEAKSNSRLWVRRSAWYALTVSLPFLCHSLAHLRFS